MNCRTFEKKINPFIKGDLKDEDFDGFYEHYKSCKGCHEELDILYFVKNILEKDDAHTSYNIKEEMDKYFSEYEEKVYIRYKNNFLRGIIYLTAEIVAVAYFIYAFLRIL